MTSQKRPHQNTQDDKYTHQDPERLQHQTKTIPAGKVSKIIQKKHTAPTQDND